MTITYGTYLDKVYGAWLGKCAGGLIGAKQENNKNLMNYTFDNVFPDQYPPNDDFDLQILYLQEVLEKKGFNYNSNDIAEVFAKHNQCWANEYRFAIRNINCGIFPKKSGEFNNDFFKNSNGCPIRSELWGLVSVGNPHLAIKLVEKDGFIDHSFESVEVEKFYAVMETMAFFEKDIKKLIKIGLNYISVDSDVYSCIEYIISLYESGKSWIQTRENIIKKFGSSDASYSVVNAGLVTLSLLYGNGNFNDTMLLCVNCGYDTDCSAATAGSIMGIILGRKGIPKDWQKKVGSEFVIGTVDIRRKENNLDALTNDTFNATYSLIRDGLNDTIITDIDKNFVCTYPVYKEKSSASFVYSTSPWISFGHDVSGFVELDYVGDHDELFTVLCDFPEYVCLQIPKSINAKAKSVIKIPVIVSLKIIDRINYRNTCEISLVGQQETIYCKFGFVGGAEYKLYGPFFDNYDTSVYSIDKYKDVMPPDLFSMFNSYANIEKEYISEDFNNLPTEHILFRSGEDKIPVEGQIGYKGTCCVYLTYTFESKVEQSAHMIIGYSAPYKVFLNGQVIASGNKVATWMPLNYICDVNLKKGKNEFVFKLIRATGKLEFSWMLSQKQFGNGVLVDVENCLSIVK